MQSLGTYLADAVMLLCCVVCRSDNGSMHMSTFFTGKQRNRVVAMIEKYKKHVKRRHEWKSMNPQEVTSASPWSRVHLRDYVFPAGSLW